MRSRRGWIWLDGIFWGSGLHPQGGARREGQRSAAWRPDRAAGAARLRAARRHRGRHPHRPARAVDEGPRRPRRGFFGRSGRFGFWPLDGGVLELSGVLRGASSLVSNSAIRAVNTPICTACASICTACARISATTSSLERALRTSLFTGCDEPIQPSPCQAQPSCRQQSDRQGGWQLPAQ